MKAVKIKAGESRVCVGIKHRGVGDSVRDGVRRQGCEKNAVAIVSGGEEKIIDDGRRSDNR